jgi:hypothetical protein
VNQREWFFLGAAALCLAMTPVTPSEFRWVSVGLGGVYLLLMIGSWLDARGRS